MPTEGILFQLLRQFSFSVYLPTALLSLSASALIPVLPALATEQGGSLWVATIVAGAAGVGQIFGTLPGGWIAGRLDEARAMTWAAAVAGTSLLALCLAPTIALATAALFVFGISSSVYSVSRHAFVTVHASALIRGRSFSLLGGAIRLGAIVGPLCGAAAVTAMSSSSGALWVAFLGALATVICQVLSLRPAPDPHTRDAPPSQPPSDPARFRSLAPSIRRSILLVGTTASGMMVLRTARNILFPLWALSIGLDAAQTSLLIALAACIDFAVFYVGGRMTDRFGLLAAALPAAIGMSGSLLLLSQVGDAVGLFVAAALFGVANGLSSGVLLTAGSYIAPRENPGPALGVFRLLHDSGAAATPLLIAAALGVTSLAGATAGLGVFGLGVTVAVAKYFRISPPKH